MKHTDMETKLELNELDELINLVNRKIHESENSCWIDLYKDIRAKLIKMFNETE